MRILVTGATGFIGARLLARLAVECDFLRVLRRESSNTGPIKNIKFEDFVGDVTDPDDVSSAVKDCDYVFHVAASVSYWDKHNKEQYDINVNGTKNIVAACLEHKVRRLIHTSSIVAIGVGEKGSFADEKTGYNLKKYNISYCDTKRLAEEEVRRGIERGLDAVIVNPGAVFGPGDTRRYRGHLYGGRVWLHYFYVGGGIATVDVDDVVDGHIRAWKKGRKGERYILASENLTFKEISAGINKKLSWPVPKIKIPTWLIYVMAYCSIFISNFTGRKPLATVPMAKFTKLNLFYSNKKARDELGVVFRSFDETNDRAIEWYQEHSGR